MTGSTLDVIDLPPQSNHLVIKRIDVRDNPIRKRPYGRPQDQHNAQAKQSPDKSLSLLLAAQSRLSLPPTCFAHGDHLTQKVFVLG
jgi:hypothetical protein